MARGGKRTPNNPAPVSGPGAASRRTDGGAGSQSQPIRVPTGQDYGEAGELEAQQRAAPLASTGSGGGGEEVARLSSQPPPGAIPQGGVFGPTERPNESPLAGAAQRPNAVAQDMHGFLNVLYSAFPHPAIARLLPKQ